MPALKKPMKQRRKRARTKNLSDPREVDIGQLAAELYAGLLPSLEGTAEDRDRLSATHGPLLARLMPYTSAFASTNSREQRLSEIAQVEIPDVPDDALGTTAVRLYEVLERARVNLDDAERATVTKRDGWTLIRLTMALDMLVRPRTDRERALGDHVRLNGAWESSIYCPWWRLGRRGGRVAILRTPY